MSIVSLLSFPNDKTRLIIKKSPSGLFHQPPPHLLMCRPPTHNSNNYSITNTTFVACMFIAATDTVSVRTPTLMRLRTAVRWWECSFVQRFAACCIVAHRTILVCHADCILYNRCVGFWANQMCWGYAIRSTPYTRKLTVTAPLLRTRNAICVSLITMCKCEILKF